MLGILLFALFALIGIAAGIVVLIQRSLFKAAIALAIVFVAVSGLIFLTSQTMVTLLQLFVLVGGLSTYLIVAVASERQATFRHVDIGVLAVVFVALGAVMLYATVNATQSTSVQTAPMIAPEIVAAIDANIALLGAVVFLMFALAIGSIMLIKRVVKLVN